MQNSQDVATRIKKVASSQNITIGKMLSDCGLNKNTLFTMQSRGYLPRAETILKIADYLDCSVDYLLGRSPAPDASAPLPPKIAELVDIASDLTEAELDVLLKMLHALAGNHTGQNP